MAQAKTDAPRRDHVGEYHRQFADSIIRQIEAGTAPWQKPWKPGERFMPENAFSGKPYTGGNALYLAQAGQERGFTDNRWATYRQIAQAGGHVKKGEHGEKILYFDTKKLSPKKDGNGRQVLDGDGGRSTSATRRAGPSSAPTRCSTWSRRAASTSRRARPRWPTGRRTSPRRR